MNKNKGIWILQGLMALVFLGAGGAKVATPPTELRANPRMAWTEDFSDAAIKAIGLAEVAGAIGLVAPAATGILPVLTPAAGAGLGALMLGAAGTHLQRGESPVAPLVLGLLAATAGLLRWRQARQTAPRR